MADITVRSSQFEEGGEIPASAAHPSVGGENKSPQLSWEGVPPETKSIALSCWDPDAPTTVGFSHWVRVGISPTTSGLEEGEPGTDGISDWGESSYGGMAPPQGDPPHHYRFTVYALDAGHDELGLGERTTYAMLRFVIRGHVLASGTLTGIYAVS